MTREEILRLLDDTNGHHLLNGRQLREIATLALEALDARCEPPAEPRFYIQHTKHYAGDYVLWWGPKQNGYTFDLDKAGLYTEEEAKRIEALRGQEKAWPEAMVRRAATKSVSIEYLRWSADQ